MIENIEPLKEHRAATEAKFIFENLIMDHDRSWKV